MSQTVAFTPQYPQPFTLQEAMNLELDSLIAGKSTCARGRTGPSSSSSSLSPSPAASDYSLPLHERAYDSGSSGSRYSPVDYSTPIADPADEFSTPIAPPWQERPDLRPPLFPPASSLTTPQTTVQRALGDTPRSAPAQQSEFDGETLKERNRRTLPAGIPSSATNLAGLLGSSAPNGQHVVSSPTSISPSSTQHQLPTITHTPHSPVPSPPSSNTPARPDRSPSRGATPTLAYSASVSIAELTELLGGAIDEIGLIDSRDTPPPTVGEPSKHGQKTDMRIELEPRALEPKAKALEPAAEVVEGPMTPTSLPTRGASLSSTRPTSPTPVQAPALATEMGAGVASSLPLERTSSTLSVTSSNPPFSSPRAGPITLTHSPTILSFQKTARPWPPAMSISTLKSHKSGGDRALAYARAIHEIARTETGLKEWCAAAAAGESHSHRRFPPIHHPPASAPSSFAQSPPSHSSSSSPFEFSPHPRNVSTGSEFPMRADSYTAREISQRVMDPADQPTALPANLPYPQLQLQHQHQHLLSSPGRRGGGLKPSQSMQSVSSFTSTKKGSNSGGGGGFFSNIRKGGSKKESLSLGPPGYIAMTGAGSAGGGGGGGGSVGKKDVRGLPISAPRSTSPQKSDKTTATATATATATSTATSTGSPSGSGSGSHTPRTVASPMGPRPFGPRGTSASAGKVGRGSFTPPPSANTAQTTTERGDRTSTSISLPPLPGRASLDTSLSRITSSPRASNARGSMDSVRRIVGGLGGKTSVPLPLPQQPQPQPSTPPPPPVSSEKGGMMDNNNINNNGEDVKCMADVLPYVEKSVLRGYLKRNGGDQMRALGAYLEDEKNGAVR
ncbi:hypothetical protein D1P53_003709 [Cryptococcus gattii VGV]|nr:hypothetical protein D1P53_003709 [Cryptococcus gattii VGV]